MSVAVGYLPGPGADSALELAAALASTLRTELSVVTVVPRPWATPSMAKVDAEFAVYSRRLAAQAHDAAFARLQQVRPEVRVGFHSVPDRSASEALLRIGRETGATILVLGSSQGDTGRIRLGTTISRLLHSSDLPMALAPNNFTFPATGITGLTCAWSGVPATRRMVTEAATMAEQLGARLRVATFGVVPKTMFPPEVGLGAERGVLAAWEDQMTEAQAGLVADGVTAPDVAQVVATGRTWTDALGRVDWPVGEILVVGTTPRWSPRRIFLGATATRIVTASPAPVLVLPG